MCEKTYIKVFCHSYFVSARDLDLGEFIVMRKLLFSFLSLAWSRTSNIFSKSSFLSRPSSSPPALAPFSIGRLSTSALADSPRPVPILSKSFELYMFSFIHRPAGQSGVVGTTTVLTPLCNARTAGISTIISKKWGPVVKMAHFLTLKTTIFGHNGQKTEVVTVTRPKWQTNGLSFTICYWAVMYTVLTPGCNAARVPQRFCKKKVKKFRCLHLFGYLNLKRRL